MCRIFPNHWAIGIDGGRFVESPKSQFFKKRYPRFFQATQRGKRLPFVPLAERALHDIGEIA